MLTDGIPDDDLFADTRGDDTVDTPGGADPLDPGADGDLPGGNGGGLAPRHGIEDSDDHAVGWSPVLRVTLAPDPESEAAPASQPFVGEHFAEARMEGTDGRDDWLGTSGDDVFDGLGGNDLIDGAGGDDSLSGGGGADTIQSGRGEDALDGGAGDDRITMRSRAGMATGGDGDDVLSGSDAGFVILFGQGGDDSVTAREGGAYMTGDAGSDTLGSGAGADVMIGGTDVDAFVFEAGFGDDVIYDLENGVEVVDLSATGLTFADLTLTNAVDAVLASSAEGSIRIQGQTTTTIDAADFLFAA